MIQIINFVPTGILKTSFFLCPYRKDALGMRLPNIEPCGTPNTALIKVLYFQFLLFVFCKTGNHVLDLMQEE